MRPRYRRIWANTICPVFAVVVLVVASVLVVSIQWPWIQKHGHMPKYIDELIKEMFSQDLFANLPKYCVPLRVKIIITQ